MIVLHASSTGRGLWVWAETDAGTPEESDGGAFPWPFAAAPEALADGLDRSYGGFRPAPERVRRLEAQLPVRDGRPVPSTPMVAELPPGEGPLRLRAWRVPAVRLRPEEVCTLLGGVGDRRLLAPGVAPSPSCRHWARVYRLALSLVASGRFLPAVARDSDREDHVSVRCEPVLAGPEGEAAGRAARGMPRAGICLLPPGNGGAGDGAARWPATVDAAASDDAYPHLRGFLHWMTDHLVRSAQWDGLDPPREPAADGEGASVHDRWLRVLERGGRRLHGTEDDLDGLREAVGAWRRAVVAESRAPFRLCFRLREPALSPAPEPAGGSDGGEEDAGDGAEDGAGGEARAGRPEGATAPDGWRLEYLVQSREDPSLQVPLSRALELSGARAEAVGDPGGSGREYLFSALGRASRLSTAVDRSLTEARPTGRELSAEEAHDFLRHEGPALEDAGFGLFLPAWWARSRRPRLRARARVRTPDLREGTGALALDRLVRFDWEVVLGEERVDRAELESLAELKSPLVRLRGEWVEVDPERIRRAARRLEEAEVEGTTLRQAVRMRLGLGEAPEWAEEAGIEFGGVRAEGWFGELVEELEEGARLERIDEPRGLAGELRPYQRRGYAWLRFLTRWGFGACLADDMGLGKTVQTLAAVQRDREEGAAGPVLVVCPTSVLNTWAREAERFTPELRVHLHHGGDRPRGEAFRAAAADSGLVATTYALLRRDVEELAEVAWRGVVLDEAQAVKNPETQRSRAARALEADYRMALTGTPVENHVGDLWAIMEFLNPGLLGSRAEFHRQFFLPIQRRRDPEAAGRLRRVTGPFVLRREKTDPDVLGDLPEKVENKVWCTLTREQATLYRAALREAEEALSEGGGGAEGGSGIGRKGRVLALLTKLKQVCNHPAHFLGDASRLRGRSGKLTRLTEMGEEILETGDRALIFTQYLEMGRLLERHLQETFGREALFLHGGVPRDRRDRMVDRFQEEAGPPFFVLSLRAGGTGLTLTRASHVFHYDRWWNPAVETQATDRAHRIGQTGTVQVHKFVCVGTLEERIDRMIESKREVAEQVVGSGEGWLTRLSDAELKEVLALDEGTAVGDDAADAGDARGDAA